MNELIGGGEEGFNEELS